MSKKKKQATEELVQTQVLNIEEVRRVANYEKKLSKKPAAICAILGVFMILLGGGSQGYISYNQMMLETNTKQRNVVARKVVDDNLQNTKSTLTCTLAKAANPDGTNFLATFTYNFTNNKLKGIKKELLMDGYNQQGLTTIFEQFTVYQSLASLGNSVDGYNITAGPHDNIGFFVRTESDLTKVDASKIPELYSATMYTSIDQKLDTKSEDVKAIYEGLGFTCTTASDSLNK